MDVERFKQSPIGTLVPISGKDARGRRYDHFAYVPNPLPPQIDLRTETWNTVSAASAALGRLDGQGQQLPNPYLLVRPFVRKEAISSSALEGTYTTLPRVLQAELFGDDDSEDQNEVQDHIRASEWSFTQLGNDVPLGINLIKQIHRRLMSSDRECPPNEKGEIRSQQNYIGPREVEMENASFVPPPADDRLLKGIYDWEAWMHRQDINPLVRMAVSHYQFETLHPFFDGNGRVGRLVALLLLLHERELAVPLLNISPYLESNRAAYQAHLREVSITGEFDNWVSFFCEGVRVQSEAGLATVRQLLTLKDEMVTGLRARRIRGLALQVAEELIGYPMMSVVAVKERYGVSYQAVSNALSKLQEAGYLNVAQMENRRKFYFCGGVYDILIPPRG